MIKTTIVASATAMVAQPIGIVRMSGPKAKTIAETMIKKKTLKAREAKFTALYDGELIDHAVVIYFQAPFSYTGEDIVEFQTHGNPYIKDRIIKLCLHHGAKMAEPGEFSQRAFENGKMSLDQVEAVADIIHANSTQAAASAARSLAGALGDAVTSLQKEMIALRVLVEAAIDFSEEDIPSITTDSVNQKLEALKGRLKEIYLQAQRGAKLTSGIKVALVGEPNVGKSTLMNRICQKEVSIVTSEAGTTRDIVSREVIHKGVNIVFSDTAGIRETSNQVESIGINRAQAEAESSDLVLILVDAENSTSLKINHPKAWVIRTKADLNNSPLLSEEMAISAKTGKGVNDLLDAIIDAFSLSDREETPFSARQRQVDILNRAKEELGMASTDQDFEIVAQTLYQSQLILSEITGEVTTDDILGEVFSSFCIGK